MDSVPFRAYELEDDGWKVIVTGSHTSTVTFPGAVEIKVPAGVKLEWRWVDRSVALAALLKDGRTPVEVREWVDGQLWEFAQQELARRGASLPPTPDEMNAAAIREESE